MAAVAPKRRHASTVEKATPDDGAPMDHVQASRLCWMKYEGDKLKLSVDRRAELVDACVNDMMASPPAR